MRTLRRRAVTIPAVLLGWMAAYCVFPILGAGALIHDLVRGRWRLPALRLMAFLPIYFSHEVAGLAAVLGLWVARPFLPEEPWRAAHWRLQRWWLGSLFGAAKALFHWTLVADGLEAARPGPVLVFPRHASLIDTLLPAVVLERGAGLRLRYVLKRELLADPCLDVVGHRLPNVFVDRSGLRTAEEVARVGALAHDLGTADGVLIYPEGTRFTPEKRARALAHLATTSDPVRLKAASALRHLLPPRPGGPLALLDAAPNADVLLLAHTGLEGLASLRELLAGQLLDREIRVQLWRVPAARIPDGAECRKRWLWARWAEIDAWIDAHIRAGLKEVAS